MFHEDITLFTLFRDSFFIFFLFLPGFFMVLAAVISIVKKEPKNPFEVLGHLRRKDVFSHAPKWSLFAIFGSVLLTMGIMGLAKFYPELFPQVPEKIEYYVISATKDPTTQEIKLKQTRDIALQTAHFTFETGTKNEMCVPDRVEEGDDPGRDLINNTPYTLYLYKVFYVTDPLLYEAPTFIEEIPPYSWVKTCCRPHSVGKLRDTWPMIGRQKKVQIYHLSPERWDLSGDPAHD